MDYRAFGVSFIALTFIAILYQLAWEGNMGKGLACIIAPYSLEVTGLDQSGNASAAQPGSGDSNPNGL